jgi:hypothetical protein
MRVLFYKHDFAWLRARGHDGHAFNIMRAMSAQARSLDRSRDIPRPTARLMACGSSTFERFFQSDEHDAQNAARWTEKP